MRFGPRHGLGAVGQQEAPNDQQEGDADDQARRHSPDSAVVKRRLEQARDRSHTHDTGRDPE